MYKTRILGLMQAVLLTCCFTADCQQQSDKFPVILPGQYQLGFHVADGKISIVQTASPNPADVWENPLADYFLSPGYHKGLELSNDQKQRIAELKRAYRKHLDTLGDNSHRFYRQATDENGKLDVEKYRTLMQENRRLHKQQHVDIEKKLNEFILPHQWTYLANKVARDTIRSEGLGNHLGNPALTKFLKVSDKQQAEIAAEAAKIVAEYDRDFAEMSKSAVKRLLSKLNAKQKDQLKKLIGEDDLTSLHDVNVVILTEQLRQVAKRNDKKSSADKARDR